MEKGAGRFSIPAPFYKAKVLQPGGQGVLYAALRQRPFERKRYFPAIKACKGERSRVIVCSIGEEGGAVFVRKKLLLPTRIRGRNEAFFQGGKGLCAVERKEGFGEICLQVFGTMPLGIDGDGIEDTAGILPVNTEIVVADHEAAPPIEERLIQYTLLSHIKARYK